MKTNKVISELKRIAARNDGLLQPETVVVEARSCGSPLHDSFTWDDRIAGHQYRLEQARHLIRVSVEIIGETQERANVFVSLTTDRERKCGGYRIMTDVLTDKQMRAQMLGDALAELENFREKYSRLKELASVFAAIRKVRKK